MDNVMTAHSETSRMMSDYGLSGDAELSERYLAERFGRLGREPQHMAYEFTTDVGYLHQYYLLRNAAYVSMGAGLPLADGFDAHSETLVARRKNHCVGGCRVTFSGDGALPMERDDFRLATLLPELKLEHERYVEISRMAILPEFQGSTVMLELSRQLLKHAAAKGARYAFVLTSVAQAREYRNTARLFGMSWDILSDVALPESLENEATPMVLSMMDLRPAATTKARMQDVVQKDIVLEPTA